MGKARVGLRVGVERRGGRREGGGGGGGVSWHGKAAPCALSTSSPECALQNNEEVGLIVYFLTMFSFTFACPQYKGGEGGEGER